MRVRRTLVAAVGAGAAKDRARTGPRPGDSPAPAALRTAAGGVRAAPAYLERR
ncbi:hypothetical protein QOM21_26280 [Streptomyces sp. Pv4-95]|uniref:hypothetical protein n=1 Tax=Streptomyces sp. Pv4-95 TaxID=3049543 RepID=UPI00389170EB